MNLPSFLTVFDKPLAFVDIETTGLRPTYDRIIEIGVLRVEDGKVTKTLNTLVNPQFHLPPEIVTITGISSSQLEDAPTFRLIKDDLLEILEGCIFIAHNSRFDYSFIKNELKRLGIAFCPKQLCSAKLSRTLYPRFRHHNLDSIIERFELDCPTRHRAFDDAAVIWQFFQSLDLKMDQSKFKKVINQMLKKPSLPNKLSLKKIEKVPEGPGVYIFYGPDQVPLYVGKSINLKERVLSHFQNDHSSSREMRISQQITDIKTISTTGELGALLLESSLVKKLQPLYNRKLRHSNSLITIKRSVDQNGFYKVEFSQDPIDPFSLDQVLGVTKSVKQAKSLLTRLAKEYNLCDKLLGIESTKSGCFGYRLNRCFGACCQKESYLKYNLRFLTAFSKLSFKDWPFDGPIIIKELDPIDGVEEAHLFDKWCYLGTVKTADDLSLFKDNGYDFDVDTYRILNSYLRSSKLNKNISLGNNLSKHLESFSL